MHKAIEEFLSQFINPPKSTPLQRAKHWLAVTQSPQQFHPEADQFELRHRRRMARQNLRRLLVNHPELMQLLRPEAS